MDDGDLTDAERRVWAAMPAGSRAALAGCPVRDVRTAEQEAGSIPTDSPPQPVPPPAT
ncbi:hypothetical protein [Micromonospora sp. WMMD964]|uniref:hypothetical protein n=1 Tax=Micromonospora sp. WMMD964 TaxID=3016091 RepID=UPI00249BBC10|nr:hypothetical protein [Micromonospora sp. WMMD964]WFF04067.1 hypothetical protein O7616_15450 [Micromonospora sp. WMMD964]